MTRVKIATFCLVLGDDESAGTLALMFEAGAEVVSAHFVDNIGGHAGESQAVWYVLKFDENEGES